MTETTVNGAEALLELFRIQGADYIFCSPIAAWAPTYPLHRPALAALPAPRPRFVLLAPIHVPWQRKPSPPLD